MGKWINYIKEKDSESILNQGDRVDIPASTSALSTMSPLTSHVANKKSYIDTCKINELKNLIKKISAYYGGDEECFLAEYTNDILMKNAIDAALICFRDLATQIPPVNNRK